MVVAALMLAATPTLSVTIATLNAVPDRFAGKQVVLTGEVDSCFGFACAICPDQAAVPTAVPSGCLSLYFDRSRFPEVDWQAIYRYATVRLTARFDPACLRPGTFCLDNATVLFDARVLDVLRRRPSADGIHPQREPLTPLASTESASLLALAKRTWRFMPIGRLRVFVTTSMAAAGREAVVCHSSLANDASPGAWPTDLAGAILARSTEDRFRCFLAERDQEGWTITPD